MTEHEHQTKQTDDDQATAEQRQAAQAEPAEPAEPAEQPAATGQQDAAAGRQEAGDQTGGQDDDEKSVEERRAERQAAEASQPAQDSPRTAETLHTGDEPHDEVPHPNPTSQQPDKGPSTSINAEEDERDVEAAHRQRQANRDDEDNGGSGQS